MGRKLINRKLGKVIYLCLGFEICSSIDHRLQKGMKALGTSNMKQSASKLRKK